MCTDKDDLYKVLSRSEHNLRTKGNLLLEKETENGYNRIKVETDEEMKFVRYITVENFNRDKKKFNSKTTDINKIISAFVDIDLAKLITIEHYRTA